MVVKSHRAPHASGWPLQDYLYNFQDYHCNFYGEKYLTCRGTKNTCNIFSETVHTKRERSEIFRVLKTNPPT